MNANQTNNQYREPDEIQIPSGEGFVVIPTYSIRADEAQTSTAKVNKKKKRSSVVGNVIQFMLMLAGVVGVVTYAGLNITGPAGLFLIAIIGGTGLLTYKAATDDAKAGQEQQNANANRTGVFNRTGVYDSMA